MKYIVARRAWVGDYLDPNTFLDMYITNGENNNTGFSNAEYDRLIAEAAKEPDKAKRMKILRARRAHAHGRDADHSDLLLCLAEYGRPYVRGLYNNLQDTHPLHAIWIDPEAESACVGCE